MAAPSLAPFNPASRRAFPRYPTNVSLDVVALRSGVPYNMPARCCDLSEAGLGAVVAGDLAVGQSVALEIRLPNVGLPIRARAVVRYQERLRCGLQFVGLPPDQREKVRYWAVQTAAQETPSKWQTQEVAAAPPSLVEVSEPTAEKISRGSQARRRRFLVLLLVLSGLVALGWWQWQKMWSELETEPVSHAHTEADIPVSVSFEAMERQILHRVDAVYPDAARVAGVQGLVVLDAVIASDGTVKHLRQVAGPEELSQSALDAVQSWKFLPYLVQGQPVEVETTISVNFGSPKSH